MKKTLILLILLVTFFNCEKTETINGKIFIKLIDIGAFYTDDTTKLTSINEQVNLEYQTLKGKNILSKTEKSELDYYEMLINNNLIGKPSFFIETDEGIYRMFSDEENYKQIKTLINDLDKSNEQINIEVQIESLADDIYFVSSINKIEKVSGITNWKK